MNIIVLDGHTLNPDGDNPWTPLAALGELTVHDRTPPELILARAADSEIVLTNKTPLTAETLAQLPRLRYVGVLATGYNVVDVEAARRRGVVVTNVPEYSTDAVAQHVFALLLTLINDPRRHDAAIREGQWQQRGDFSFTLSPLFELAGKTVGIVGYGKIGRRVGQIARAFGMPVIAHTRSRPGISTNASASQREPASNARAERAHFDDGTPWLALDALFAQSDVVTLHLPQTPETAGFVNRALLRTMKPTAFLLNTARGGLVNEADLAAALVAGELAGAALDVVSAEPIQVDNPLLDAPNCLITPHIAWAALEARRRLMGIAARNVRTFLDGRPENVVG